MRWWDQMPTVPYITLNKSRAGFPSKSLHPRADQTSSDRTILEGHLWSDFFFYDKLDCFVGHSVTKTEERESCSRPHEWAYSILACQVTGFLVAPVVKNLPASAGVLRDSGSIPGSGRFPGGEHGNPLQYSCLENPMDGGAWRTTVHGVAKSQTRLKRRSTHACGVMQ